MVALVSTQNEPGKSDTLNTLAADPPWLVAARAETGVAQFPRGDSNPRITEYHAHANLRGYDDKAAWCSSFADRYDRLDPAQRHP